MRKTLSQVPRRHSALRLQKLCVLLKIPTIPSTTRVKTSQTTIGYLIPQMRFTVRLSNGRSDLYR